MIMAVTSRIRNLLSDHGFSEILTGSVYAVGARIVATGLGFVSSIVVARYYGAGVMGILAVIESFLMLATVLAMLGTSTSILRLIPEHMARHSPTSAFRVYRKTQFFVLAVAVVIGGALYLSSGFVANSVFAKPDLVFFFALAAPFVIIKSLMLLNTQAVRGLRLVRTFALMQLLPPLSMLVLLVILTLLFENRNIPVFTLLASWVVTALAGAWIMDRTFKRRMNPDDEVRPLAVTAILALSLPMLLSATMYFVIGQTGVIMLGIFRTEAEVGYYAVAVKLAGLTALILTAVNSMAAPKFSELFHTGQTDEILRVAKKATKLIFWTTAPILLGLIAIGKPLLGLVFGQQFTVAYGAMVLLVLGQFVNSISGSTGIFMNMTGHQKTFQNIMLASAGLCIVLNLLLIPQFGIMGAALSAMVTVASWNIYTLVYIKAKFGRSIGYFPLIARG